MRSSHSREVNTASMEREVASAGRNETRRAAICNQRAFRLVIIPMPTLVPSFSYSFPFSWSRAASLAVILLVAVRAGLDPAGAAPPPEKAIQILQLTNVWTLNLTFTPEQWEAMEPAQAEGGPFGRRGQRPGEFGPGMFVAPAFLKAGDANGDGKLSGDEFGKLGEKWFREWDKAQRGKLNSDQVRTGLTLSLAPAGPGNPGGGPGGPGGRGMNLQGPQGKRNGLASAAGIEFKYVHADLDFGGRVFKDVAVRYKGNGTWMQSQGSEKRSLKIDLNHFVKGQKLAGMSQLNLHNSVTDPSWMNEVLSHRLFRDAGVPAPRTAYARVFVTVKGKFEKKYLGLYSLVEDIDGTFVREHFGAKGGALFKPVTPELFADLGDNWEKYQQTYDPKTEVDAKQTRRIIEFSKLVAKSDDAQFAAKLGDYLDLDEFATFMAVTVWLSTLDSILGPGQNYYLYLHPKTQKFSFMPWDLDHSFGQFGLMGTQEQREKLSIHKPWRGENRFLERVYKVDSFKSRYLRKLGELQKTVLQPERFQKQVDQIAAAIRPAVREESETKLARFEKVVVGETVEPAGFGGFGGPRTEGAPPPPREGGEGPRSSGPGRFMQPAKPIKGFVIARAPSVQDQLAGKSKGETIGDFGFGGPRGPGGRPGGFGPGMFLGPAMIAALDTDKDEELTRDEFLQGFAKWFQKWTDGGDTLSEQQLRAGINRDLAPAGRPPR